MSQVSFFPPPGGSQVGPTLHSCSNGWREINYSHLNATPSDRTGPARLRSSSNAVRFRLCPRENPQNDTVRFVPKKWRSGRLCKPRRGRRRRRRRCWPLRESFFMKWGGLSSSIKAGITVPQSFGQAPSRVGLSLVVGDTVARLRVLSESNLKTNFLQFTKKYHIALKLYII